MARCGDLAQAWIKKGWSHQGKYTEKCTLIRYMYQSYWIMILRSDWSGLSDHDLFGASLNPNITQWVYWISFSRWVCMGYVLGLFMPNNFHHTFDKKFPETWKLWRSKDPKEAKCWRHLVKLPIILSDDQSHFHLGFRVLGPLTFFLSGKTDPKKYRTTAKWCP